MPYTNTAVRIHFVEQGKGPALLLHHGFSWSSRRWQACGYVESLERDYRVIAIDARGHGKSDKPHDPASYSAKQQAQDVVAMMDELGIEKALFWGYSMGGRAGYALAKYAPERLHALVISASHPYARTLAAADRINGDDPREFVEALYRRTGASLDALPADARLELFENDFHALAACMGDWPTFEDVLPLVPVPTLLYVGDKDPIFPRVQSAAELIPNVEFTVYPGQDHGSIFRESGLVLPSVKAFLRQAHEKCLADGRLSA